MTILAEFSIFQKPINYSTYIAEKFYTELTVSKPSPSNDSWALFALGSIVYLFVWFYLWSIFAYRPVQAGEIFEVGSNTIFSKIKTICKNRALGWIVALAIILKK